MPRAAEPNEGIPCTTNVDASLFELILFDFNRLTVLPCFLDGFLPFPTICGPSGTHKRWDFKVNFVAVIL